MIPAYRQAGSLTDRKFNKQNTHMNIVYIDVQNTHKATQKLWRLIEWSKFYIYLKDKCKADIIYYAVWYISQNQSKYKILRFLINLNFLILGK